MRDFNAEQVERLLGAFATWSKGNAAIRGVALVGSWDTIDREHSEADLDVVMLVDDPQPYRSGSAWMTEIDWPAAGLGTGHWTESDYEGACARHIKFADGGAVEVSFVTPEWASVAPVDPVTRRVAGNGMRVIHDPDGLLGRLVAML